MVIRQPFHLSPAPLSLPKNRATILAVGASIAVRLAIGGYLLGITFHPFNLAEPADAAPMVIQTYTPPTRPAEPMKQNPVPGLEPRAAVSGATVQIPIRFALATS
jgi:hypothetical protein